MSFLNGFPSLKTYSIKGISYVSSRLHQEVQRGRYGFCGNMAYAYSIYLIVKQTYALMWLSHPNGANKDKTNAVKRRSDKNCYHDNSMVESFPYHITYEDMYSKLQVD